MGPEYYVNIMSFVDKSQLEPGCAVLLHNKGLNVVGVLADDVDPIQTYLAIQERGVLTTLAGGDVLRVCPALNVTTSEIDEGIEVIRTVLENPPRK